MRLIVCVLLMMLVSFGQAQPEKGYKITLTLDGADDKMLYMFGNYGDYTFIVDSAVMKNRSRYIFKNKKYLPEGIYTVRNKNNDTYLSLLIDNSRYFSIETEMEAPLNYRKITGSDDNKYYFNYLKALIAQEDITPFVTTSPKSLLAKYVKAQHFAENEITETDDVGDLTQKVIDLYFHFFNHIDLKDTRLLRTPIDIHFDYYFSELLSYQDAPFVINAIQNFFDAAGAEVLRSTSQQMENQEVAIYYLKKLFAIYLHNQPAFDTIPVWLFDNYYSKIANTPVIHYTSPVTDSYYNKTGTENLYFSATEDRVIRKIVERKRKLLPGNIIPPLAAYNIDHQLISTDKIDKKYIIIWLWDPDCDHCIEETPKLNHFYKNFHNVYQFEIFAVSVTDDFERWKKFIEDHKLQWLNASYAIDEPNYDFIDYFDILTTPAIYLINKSHVIIERQFSLDDIYSIFESLDMDN